MKPLFSAFDDLVKLVKKGDIDLNLLVEEPYRTLKNNFRNAEDLYSNIPYIVDVSKSCIPLYDALKEAGASKKDLEEILKMTDKHIKESLKKEIGLENNPSPEMAVYSYNFANLFKATIEGYLRKNNIDFLPEYLKILENASSNNLITFLGTAKKERFNENIQLSIDHMLGGAVATIGKGKTITNISIENFKDVQKNLNPSISKLVDFALYWVNEFSSDGYTCEIPITDYMDYLGRKVTSNNIKEVQKEIRPYLIILPKINLTHISKSSNDLMSADPIPFAQQKGKKIIIQFLPKFIEALGNKFMYLPHQAGKLSSSAYMILRKIYEHSRTNASTKFALSLDTLLNISNLPTHEEVMNGNRNITSRIIEPFDKCIQEIEETIGTNKIKLQYRNGDHNNWSDFINDYIEIELSEVIEGQYKIVQEKREKHKRKVAKLTESKKKKGRKTGG